MNFRFEQPVWFWLLLALVPITLIGLASFASMSPARRVTALLARLVLYGLILAMLAGLATVRKTDRLAIVALVDVSGSVRRYAGNRTLGDDAPPRSAPQAAQEYLRRATRAHGPDDLVGIVAFDARAAAAAVPSRATIESRDLDLQFAEGTNIADAIRLGRALIPPDASGRLLLFSDGNETAGNAAAAAAEGSAPGLLTRGSTIPIDVIPLTYTLSEEVSVDSVDAPPTAAAGATINVRVALTATAATRGTLQLLRENTPIDLNGDAPGTGRAITLVPGQNVEQLEVRLDTGRVHRFKAIFEPDVVRDSGGGTRTLGDTTPENNRAEAFTITPGKGSALIVNAAGDSAQASTLAQALRNSGVDVIVAGPEGMPQDLLSLQAYDVVLLDNIPVDAVAPRLQETLVAYVRDLGGGLVMIGGPDSFGAGGWRGSPIENILPVSLDIPDRLITPEVAIVFVLDNSGSMGNFVLGATRSQQEIANEAAAMAIRTLDRRDLVGVVTFNSNADVVWPLQPNRKTAQLVQEVLSINPGGGTNMAPGLERAREQLAASTAKVKHVVVLSDGKSQRSQSLPDLAEQMRKDGIKLSMIAVGDDADTRTMAVMAERGDGVFYHAINANQLPKIFLKAVRLVRTPLIRETPFDPIVLPTGSPMMAGIDAPPPLNGLALTQTRDLPTIINAIVTPSGEPVLSHWNVGLGQVVAFTSDASHWATPWLDWPGYERLWTQIVRQSSRPPGSRRFQAGSHQEGSRITLRLEAQDDDGHPMERLDVPVTVYTPSGEAHQARLTQTGPGVYEGEVEAQETGSYVSLIKPASTIAGEQRRLPPVIVGSTIQEGAEFRARQSNDALLADIARRSGGRVLALNSPETADLFNRAKTTPREAIIPIWRTLLFWTLGVFFLDVATRRIAWDRWASRRFRPEADAAAERARAAEAARTTAGLRARREPDTAPAPTPVIALSDADAANLAAAARDRRRAQRLAAHTADTTSQTAIAPDPSAPAQPPAESGLLAAKRRAAERFEE